MEEGQNCGCDNTEFEPTCIERCKEGLECKGEDKIYSKGTCMKIQGDIDNHFTLLDIFSLITSNFFSLTRKFYYLRWIIFSFLHLDPCDSSPCKNGGTCYSLGRNYYCECPRGYQYEHGYRTDYDCSYGILFWSYSVKVIIQYYLFKYLKIYE